MNTCGTCRYRSAEPDERDGPPWYWCEKIVHPKDGPKGLAFVEDAEGYAACLVVQNRFGCNQWSKK